MQELLSLVGLVVVGGAIVVGISVLLSVPVWLLWNWLVPAIFGLPSISLLQAVGLNTLSGLLFKSYTSSGKK